MKIHWRSVAILSLAFLPIRSGAEWVARQRISDKTFADVVAAGPTGRRRLYGITRSGVKTPTVNGNPKGGVIIGLNISARSSDVFEVSNASGVWKTRSADFHEQDDGSRIAEVDCGASAYGGFAELTLQYSKGRLARMTVGDDPTKKAWSFFTRDPNPAAAVFWPRSHFWNPETRTLLDGRSEYGTRLCGCSCIKGAAPAQTLPVLDGHQPVIMAFADLRGEGKKSYYAFGVGGAVLELSETDGRWSIRTVIEKADNLDVATYMSAGDGRGDGKPRLYVAKLFGLIEYEWRDGGFHKTVLQAQGGSGGFAGATTGLLIGGFRSDGRARVYVSNEGNLVEFFHVDGGWIKNIHPLGIGRIAAVKAEDFGGRRQLLALGDAGGLYLVEWREQPVVAVLPFYARGVDPSEGRAFAEIHATKVAALGDCRVVERDRVDSVIRELKLHGSGLVDRKQALKAANLLKADYVVTGSVGRLFDQQLAALSVVSVKDGEIGSSDFTQWLNDSELDRNIQKLALKACPR